jgi:hypothetical protein
VADQWVTPAKQRAPRTLDQSQLMPRSPEYRSKPNGRACAALAGKRSFAADATGGRNAQTPVVRRRLGERLKSTRSGSSGTPPELAGSYAKRTLPTARRGLRHPIGRVVGPTPNALGAPALRRSQAFPASAKSPRAPARGWLARRSGGRSNGKAWRPSRTPAGRSRARLACWQ